MRAIARPVNWVSLTGTLAFSAAVTSLLLYYQDELESMGDWVYLGAFLTQLVNNATILLPALGQAFIVATGASLDPYLLGVFGGIGAALGEITGYLLGLAGRHTLLKDGDRFGKLLGHNHRWAGVTIFFFALTPLPFDLAGIWAGSDRYPLGRFFFYTAAGKIISTTGLALAGYYSVSWLERVFD